MSTLNTSFARWSRTLKTLAAMLLTLALLAPSGAALAAEESGSGTITAKGAGYARIEGDGTIIIGGGAGTIWITGAEEIKATGRGRKTTFADGTIRLTGYSGAVTITGEEMVVKIEGAKISLTATGTGSALLKGRGGYTVGSATGTWTKAGKSVSF
jgi:hypothetical protein